MGALRLLITGAAGYVGRATVTEARARGHPVLALVRRENAVPADWRDDDGIEVLLHDLGSGAGLAEACAQVDAVLHLAASMSGDRATHARDTLAATRTLLDALPRGMKLVHLSSVAVYDFRSVRTGGRITEATPLLREDGVADAYATAKRSQEAMISRAAHDNDLKLTVLRAGAVFGPERLWNAHLGFVVGPTLIRLGRQGQIPLCHISTCAEALIAAAERPATAPINVLDEDLPDRARYLRALKNGPRVIVPFGWRLLLPLAGMATRLHTSERLPGLLQPDVLRARFLPVSFDNSRMRDTLGVRQAQGFEVLMHAAQGGELP